MAERIRRRHGYRPEGYTYYPVLIIGGGESGIAMGCRLMEVLNFDQFRIFDRQSGLGGTWWINRYPGVACDVWTSFHPSGEEIVDYLGNVSAKYGITDKIQLNTEVSQCTWLEDEGLWEVQLEHLLPGIGDLSSKARQRKVDELGRSSVIVATEIVKAKIVISAVGGLVEPKDWPREIPGREKFQGDIFHSARWDSTISFKDKHVVVLGTGCSAAQFVPKLIERPYDAKKVTQLMRSPPWVQPRVKPPFGDKGWATWGPWLLTNIPGLARLLRTLMFLVIERDFRLFGGGEYHAKERGKTERALLRYMKKTVPAKYHAILTPDYEVGCKRRIFDSKWFPSLKDARVELSTLPLRSLDARSITIGPGCLYRGPGDLNSDEKSDAEERVLPADIIILANGFDVANWSHPLVVKGRNGLELIDVMMQRGGPQAYQGTAMDGFPNFLIIFGPNTATGHSSVILATENMVNYALNFVRLVLQGDATMFEIKRTAEMQYTADIQLKLKNTVFMSGGCQSWYFTKDGWNATALPCLFPHWNDWNIQYTRKGVLKYRLYTIGRLTILSLFVLSLYHRRTLTNVLGKTIEHFYRLILM